MSLNSIKKTKLTTDMNLLADSRKSLSPFVALVKCRAHGDQINNVHLLSANVDDEAVVRPSLSGRQPTTIF